jgi:hypothetical protein
MSGSSSVPLPTFTDTGFVAPPESAILAGRLSDINAAFGGALNVTNLFTPQGQLASSEAAILGDTNALLMALFNSVDPAFASGRMQDAIGRIYFLDRIAAASTVTDVACVGAVGTVIPVGSLLTANDGNQYISTETGTIPTSGTVLIQFACNVTGPVICPAQTFVISRTVNGWNTAISSAAGTIGNLVEGRAAFEARRQASVAINALGSVGSIRAAVLTCAGVLDAFVVDNPSGNSTVIGGVTLAPHSLYVAVVGGVAADIARAIWMKKSIGCNYNGNTTVSVTDNNGYTTPLPTYAVTFDIPVPTSISVVVNLAYGSGAPSNALALIQAAIMSAFVGGDGGPRARIGSTLYASRFYSAVTGLGAWAQVLSIQIGTTSGNQNSLTLPVNQTPVTDASNISVNYL